MDINSNQFADKVLNNDKYTLVDFWAPWCMPCRMMAPVLEELATDNDLKGSLEIYKINTDESQNQMLAMMFDIRSIPNMKLFKNGKVVGDFVGLRDKDSFKKELLQAMKQ